VVLDKFWQRGSGLEELGCARSSSSTWQRPGLCCTRGCNAKIPGELVLELKAGAHLQKGRASSVGQLHGYKATAWLTAAGASPPALCCVSLFKQYLPA